MEGEMFELMEVMEMQADEMHDRDEMALMDMAFFRQRMIEGRERDIIRSEMRDMEFVEELHPFFHAAVGELSSSQDMRPEYLHGLRRMTRHFIER